MILKNKNSSKHRKDYKSAWKAAFALASALASASAPSATDSDGFVSNSVSSSVSGNHHKVIRDPSVLVENAIAKKERKKPSKTDWENNVFFLYILLIHMLLNFKHIK